LLSQLAIHLARTVTSQFISYISYQCSFYDMSHFIS